MCPYKSLGLFAAVSALSLGTALTFGDTTTTVKLSSIDPHGHPKQFTKGHNAAYALWHEKGKGWRLRTTTHRYENHFRGSITVEGGTIVHAHGHMLEKEGRLADHWQLGPNRQRLTFNFKTDKGIDGINFTVSKAAKAIRFNLHVNGKHAAHLIYVGHTGGHPKHDPFALPAHPHKKK